MKERTKKRICGAISVLLVIILLPMMTLSALIVDSSRINMSQAMVSSAGDLTMNAALADYDTILKDVYGLFAMSQDKTDEELAEELKGYFQKTLVSYGVTTEAESGEYVQALIGDFNQLVSGTKNGSITNFMDMKVGDDFRVSKVPESSLSSAGIMRSQIVEYMKYRAPLNFGMSFLDSIKAFKNVQDQTAVVEKQVAAQESTQDVTRACSDAINEIRSYDDLIHSIQEGEKAVKGLFSKDDGIIVPLEKYHGQVDHYRDEWADNYQQINKLTMIFLANAPSADSVYLRALSYPESEFFILRKNNETRLAYDKSGISVSISLAGATAAAKAQVEQQAGKLESGTEMTTANKYREDSTFRLKSENLVPGYTRFTDEDRAINAFIEFERFLLDDPSAGLKYSDVKNALEQIYTLGKYFDNYNAKIGQDIAKAEQEKKDADRAVTTADAKAASCESSIAGNIEAINNANSGWDSSLDFLSGVKSGGRDMRAVVESLLEDTETTAPSTRKNSSGRQFVRYDSFLSSAYGGGSSGNSYLKAFRDLAASGLSSKSDYSDICSAAGSYVSDRNTHRTTKPFTDYVREKAGSKAAENELTQLMDMLYQNHERVVSMENSIREYDEVYNGYAELKNKAVEKATALQKLQDEQKNVKAKYEACLSRYDSFVKLYQSDAYYYDRYIGSTEKREYLVNTIDFDRNALEVIL